MFSKDEIIRIMKKILILGPPKAGKSTLASFLSEYMGDESREHDDPETAFKYEFEFSEVYRPTKGVRINEFESHEFFSNDEKNDLESSDQRVLNVEVQLWDVSGDTKYDDCWPAIKENTDGVILVANPEEHTGSDMVMWYREFVEKEGIQSENVLVILNEQGPKKTNHELVSAFKITPQLRGAHHIACHFGSEGDTLKSEVNQFLVRIMLQGNRRESSIAEPIIDVPTVNNNNLSVHDTDDIHNDIIEDDLDDF